jgi:hypothetical protein
MISAIVDIIRNPIEERLAESKALEAIPRIGCINKHGCLQF